MIIIVKSEIYNMISLFLTKCSELFLVLIFNRQFIQEDSLLSNTNFEKFLAAQFYGMAQSELWERILGSYSTLPVQMQQR